jgi:negative regulator of sigma E activity
LRTQHLFKHRHNVFLLTAVLCAVMVVLLAACSANDAPPSDVSAGDIAAVELAASDIPLSGDAQTNEADDEDANDEQASDQVAAAPQQLNACLNCHSDKEQLIATAAPEQEMEAESEGEG